MVKKSVLVSVIIPAYNVSKYIDQCLKSVCEQTLRDIEIIVVNDGSTDDTFERCIKWKERDNRIILINQANHGLGPARNVGLKKASGKYILFLDSDDWIDVETIETCYKIGEMNQADLVIFNYFEYDEITKEIVKKKIPYYMDGIVIENENEKKEFLFRGWCMAWCKLYRTAYLIENEIYMPTLRHEDIAVFPSTIFYANKIVYCEKALYYYRVNREGSIINTGISGVDIPNACRYFVDFFKKKGIFEFWRGALKFYFDTRVWYAKEKVLDIDILNQIEQQEKDVNALLFPNTKRIEDYSMMLIGGFGSRYIVQRIGIDRKQLVEHYPFASLISLMHMGESSVKVCNRNPFRTTCVENDIKGDLYCRLIKDKINQDYLFIDFVEERFDILVLSDGNMLTESDAFIETQVDAINIERKVLFGSDEYLSLWKSACTDLITQIKEQSYRVQVVLLKMPLAEEYFSQNELCQFPNIDQIRSINRIHEEMERYFEECFGDALKIYTVRQRPYSDSNFKFGCEPQYYNYKIYDQIITNIRASLED